MILTRRRFLALLPPLIGSLLLAACGGDEDDQPGSDAAAPGVTEAPRAPTTQPTSSGGGTTQLQPTAACGDEDDEATLAQTEGPFFTPNSPRRTSLREGGITGTLLVVEGLVVDTSCRPIAGVLVDFWHTDDAGEYDNVGYRLRGHQFTDSAGRYRLETIMPGVYTGRTRHIHVKVQAPNRPVLTTQLYFPGESQNARDGIFDESLVMEMSEAGGTKTGRFQFVLNI